MYLSLMQCRWPIVLLQLDISLGQLAQKDWKSIERSERVGPRIAPNVVCRPKNGWETDKVLKSPFFQVFFLKLYLAFVEIRKRSGNNQLKTQLCSKLK